MKYSTTITKIAPALLAAQKEIGAAKKDAENPFFHSTYADLGSVMEACKEALNKNGITVLQPIGTNECGVYVETVLLHESGEWISDGMRISPKSDTNPQDQGSAISYARRYSLQSMVFIPSEDDDANKATEISTRKPAVTEESFTRVPAGDEPPHPADSIDELKTCSAHEEPVVMRKGYSESKKKNYWYHDADGKRCFGSGWM